MSRHGSVIRIDAENLAEYRRLHAAVWPGVLQTLTACHIHNYSIYHRNGWLFAYFEYAGDDYDVDMARVAADPVTQEWWAGCMPLQQPLANRGPSEWWAELEELFHLD